MFVSKGPTGAVWAVSYVLNHLGDSNETDYQISRKMDDGWQLFTMPQSIEFVTDIVVDDDGTPWPHPT